MPQRTALFTQHIDAGGKMVDFAGWEMPLHYGSQLNEHHQIRRDAGVFDVSHMTIVDLRGAQAHDFLRFLLANDVARLKTVGKALYSCMLNPHGGVIDDLIVYFCGDQHYRLVVNAATRDKDLAWISQQAESFEVSLQERRDLAMLAIQGPNARSKTLPLLPKALQDSAMQLGLFFSTWNDDWFVARTGYTGEDGFEIILPNQEVVDFWKALLNAGIKPAGLGARDTLRLEAGMCLYGADMDDNISPCEAGLKWTVAFQPEERDFIGRAALKEKCESNELVQVGLLLLERGVLRNHQKVLTEKGNGEITSGTFSPTLGRSIALARVPADCGEQVQVEIREKLFAAQVVRTPFVRHGKALV
ncbi:MAG: glycine cleavage system aminomethyltransferase GcvT [Pseudomonadota bacterium]